MEHPQQQRPRRASKRPSDQQPHTMLEPGQDPSSAEQVSRGERLQKYLARCGVASRRHAEALITAGRVTVNGQVARELGVRVDPASDEVAVDGTVVHAGQQSLYILMHKPAGVVTTMTDPQGRQTVIDLLPQAWQAERVYPVGRLDLDTEGLLLLTNDGEFALRLTHPRYSLPKEYHALVEGRPTPQALARLEQGLMLAGETRPTAPARAWALREEFSDMAWVGVELHEGRKRQVRRMLSAVGYPVVRLRRVRVGPQTLGDLPNGAARLLTEREVDALRRAAGASQEPDGRKKVSAR